MPRASQPARRQEPLRRWDGVGHARLSAAVGAAVASGENLSGLEQFRPLLDAGAPDVVQPGAVWGITHALRLAHVASARDLPVSLVGYHANPAVAHVMAAIPNHLTTEVQDLRFATGLTVDHGLEDGGVELSTAPGVGIRLDEPALTAASGSDRLDGAVPRPPRAGLRVVADGTAG